MVHHHHHHHHRHHHQPHDDYHDHHDHDDDHQLDIGGNRAARDLSTELIDVARTTVRCYNHHGSDDDDDSDIDDDYDGDHDDYNGDDYDNGNFLTILTQASPAVDRWSPNCRQLKKEGVQYLQMPVSQLNYAQTQ